MAAQTLAPEEGPAARGSVEERLDRLAAQLDQVSEELTAQRRQRERLEELTHELTALSGAGMAAVTEALAVAEAKGYFSFARGSAAIVDKVVTSFDEDDVRALGDNIVLILNTVKEMTQPEVMGMLRRTAVTIQEVEEAPAAQAPSTLALLKQMRDPEVRRGLERTLSLLRSVGAEQPNHLTPKETLSMTRDNQPPTKE